MAIQWEGWDEFFLGLSEFIATKSKDRRTQVGAVIVGPDNEIVSPGFNGFPRGIDDNVEARHSSLEGTKYKWTEHAERNAIYNAARMGVSVKGCTMYLTWYGKYPCPDCARAIIQSGIRRVVGVEMQGTSGNPSWDHDLEISREMLEEAGVEVEIVKDYKSIRLVGSRL